MLAEGFDQVDGNEAIRFDRLPPDEDAVERLYMPGSGITVQGSTATRFIYRLGALPTLPAGRYTLRVISSDFSSNQAQRDAAFGAP